VKRELPNKSFESGQEGQNFVKNQNLCQKLKFFEKLLDITIIELQNFKLPFFSPKSYFMPIF